MGTLTVGRVGLDVAMSDPAEWTEGRGLDNRETRIRGYLRSSSIDNTKALRTELLEQQGKIVALTYSLDSTMDGFYILTDVVVETIPVSFMNKGLFPYEITLWKIGGSGATEFQSLVTGTVRDNEHAITAGETQPIHAPARLHKAYGVDAGTAAIQDTVSTEDGNLNRYYLVDYAADPSWSVEPSNYYSAGAYIEVGGRLRAGLDAPTNPASFEVGNKIIKIVPSTSGSVSDGRLDVSWWTGAAYTTPVSFEFYFNANRIPEWHYTSIISNTPETCRFRLIRDAEDTNSIFRHVLDIEVRRGCAFASFFYTFSSGTGPTYIQIREESSTDTLLAVAVAGADDTPAYYHTADGWSIGSSRDLTAPAASGGVRIDNYVGDFQRDFYIGYQLSAGAPDRHQDMCLQYHGPLYVQERAVRR